MKLLFTADLHIKLGQKNVPVEWVKNRFTMFLSQLSSMQSNADFIVIGGDIFDRLPTMDELELYFELVESIKIPCVIYSGNHEALNKDTTFLSYIKRATNRLNKNVSIVDTYETILDGKVDILPYNKLKEYDESKIDFKSRILCTHVRGNIPPHVKSEVDLDIFKKWDVVLAGDLHSYSNSQGNILYPGSPYTTSFHRNPVETGAIILDIDTLEHEWVKFNLPQLYKITVSADSTDIKATDFHHTVYEIEGNLQDLAGMQADGLIVDKKVVRRTNESQLILTPDMPISDELREYLSYVLMLPNDAIEQIIEEFYNHLNKLET